MVVVKWTQIPKKGYYEDISVPKVRAQKARLENSERRVCVVSNVENKDTLI